MWVAGDRAGHLCRARSASLPGTIVSGNNADLISPKASSHSLSLASIHTNMGASIVETRSNADSAKVLDLHHSLPKRVQEGMYKTIFRSFSQDFQSRGQGPIPHFLSSVSSHFPTVHQSQSSDLVVPANASQLADPGGVTNGSLDSSGGSFAVCLPSESSLTDSLQASVSESANEEGGEGEYVNLYSSSQANGEMLLSHGVSKRACHGEAEAAGSMQCHVTEWGGGKRRLYKSFRVLLRYLACYLVLVPLMFGSPQHAGCTKGCMVEAKDLTTTSDDVIQDTASQNASSNSKETSDLETRRQKSTDSGQSDEEVDELSLIDHKEIMSRITLKQEAQRPGVGVVHFSTRAKSSIRPPALFLQWQMPVRQWGSGGRRESQRSACLGERGAGRGSGEPEILFENDDGPDVRAGSGDILLVHATETDRKDVFKKRVSKNTFFVLVRVVDELCLVELTDDILKQLMDLVFRLVCNGELSLARVLRKNILDKVEQKKLLRYTNSLKPLAARGVAARPGTLHDFRSHEIADQLTLLDAELFYKIEVNNVLHVVLCLRVILPIPEVLLWAKEQNEEKSPNLTQFTEHFNNMSYW
ncbi:hypothetical protein JZ751_012341 [Albula glossodonta]|uniref:Ras-GEF domain-containing protein n=1 Tax=Albula glossodonta TaxID=121402 RepID=A0A8T2PS32_9TELE|nr:hypothetical protein JZ751_012341 [Albula glossodonta]